MWVAILSGFLVLALVGHAAFWVSVVNRWHGTGYPRPAVKGVSVLFYAALFGIPLAILWHFAQAGASSWLAEGAPVPLDWATAYLVLAAVFGLVHIPLWLAWRWRAGRPVAGVRHRGTELLDLCRHLGGPPTTSPRTKLFHAIPFNQLWQLETSEYTLELERLPAALEGLSICHISDLHFSPRIERPYFDEVVRITNSLACDLVALTGDVCDKARFISWVPETLGRIEAERKFAILGNHDLRTRDTARLRGAIREAGFVDIGGELREVPDMPLVVAGNERPWFRHAVPDAMRMPPDRFKLLLSHTPDELPWASAHGFDLMLAGHTHGGQIRFPLIGPVICPSWYGTRYAAGFFRRSPTLLHVSRGTASLFPYRMNCRPEIIKLVLRRKP